MSKALGQTAHWIAASRARESLRSDRLFEDPLAARLAGPQGFELLKQLAPRAGLGADKLENPYHVIRTRFFDEALLEALNSDLHQTPGPGLAPGLGQRPDPIPATGRIRQVVMPAAGLDTRAYRLDWPPGCRLFELDSAELLAYKQGILDASGLSPRCERLALGLDLTLPFAQALRASGFDPSLPAYWLIEGLFYYLDTEAAAALLARCSQLAAPGSRLGADLIGEAIFKLDWTRPVLAQMEALGAPWRFGHDDPEGFFAAQGWDADVRLPGAADAHFGRWPHPLQARDTPGQPQTFLVKARR